MAECSGQKGKVTSTKNCSCCRVSTVLKQNWINESTLQGTTVCPKKRDQNVFHDISYKTPVILTQFGT